MQSIYSMALSILIVGNGPPPPAWRYLTDLAGIIRELNLNIVWGKFKKEGFNKDNGSSDAQNTSTLHFMALLDCLVSADRWLLAKYSPSELATVVHEDGTPAKPIVKKYLRLFRSIARMDSTGFPPDVRERVGLPLKRIIDTAHFAEKPDARPLQLADLCAFILGRQLKGASVPREALKLLFLRVTCRA